MSMKYIKDADKNFKSIIEKSNSVQSTKYLISSLAKLREAITEAKDNGASNEYLRRLEEDGLHAINADLLLNKQKELEDAQNNLNQLQERYNQDYEKDHALHDFRIRNLERKLYAKTDKELQAIIQNKEHLFDDPNMANTFLSVLNDRGLDDLFSEAKTQLLENNYDKPYLKSDEGKLLQDKIELINANDLDILLRDESGNVFGMQIGELWQMEKDNAEEADDAE